MVGGAVGQLIRRSLGAVTEALDVINAAYYALPQALRDLYRPADGSRLDQVGRMSAVLAHYDQIAIDEFLLNLAIMEAQDRLIAAGARQRQGIYRQIGRDAGLPDPTGWAARMAKLNLYDLD